MDGKKKFGLILTKKTDVIQKKLSNVFNNSSDEEIMDSTSRPKIPQSKSVFSNNTKSEHLEDPSIYEYDSIYDDMKEKQIKEAAPKEKKNSRYIETLLKAADKRKKQYERRIEKKIQIEREKEGDKFKDKEAFVTSSYKKKMEEMEEEEERERRENEINEMMDVTKQKDLSGFYRHFLKQTVGEEKIPVYGDSPHIKEEVLSEVEENSAHETSENKFKSFSNKKETTETYKSKIDNDTDLSSDDEELQSGTLRKMGTYPQKSKSESNKVKSTLNISEDLVDSNSNESNPEENKNMNNIKRKNCFEKEGKDEEFSSSFKTCKENSLSEHNSVKNYKKKKIDMDIVVETSEGHVSSDDSKQEKDEELLMNNSKSIAHDENHHSDQKRLEKQRNIFEKRTVGSVFADAQARYFQRMAARTSGI